MRDENLKEILAAAYEARDTDLAAEMIIEAVQEPVQEAVYQNDMLNDIFTVNQHEPHEEIKYQTDLVTPGKEGEFVAYNVSSWGDTPIRVVEPGWVRVITKDHFASIEIPYKVLEYKNVNNLELAMKNLKAQIVQNMNDVGWAALMNAAHGRNILQSDGAAGAGKVTLILFQKMRQKMRRASGSNAGFTNAFSMTHLFMSPEAIGTLTELSADVLDDYTKSTILMTGDGKVASILGVKLVDIVELGAGGKYQKYYTDRFALADSDTELLIGVDANKKDKNVLAMKGDLKISEDVTYRRKGLLSLYTRYEFGAAVIDNRLVINGSC